MCFYFIDSSRQFIALFMPFHLHGFRDDPLCPPGDRVLGHAALVRREEAVRAHHALPHLGGPEGRGLGARDGAPRGGARGPQEGPPLGAPGQEPHPGQ